MKNTTNVYLKNKNRLTGVENKLVVTSVEETWRGETEVSDLEIQNNIINIRKSTSIIYYLNISIISN